MPAATPLPIYQQVTLKSVPAEENGTTSNYKITTQTPLLTGSNDPSVETFNNEMVTIVKSAVDDFKQKMIDLGPAPIQAQSTFDLKYEQTAQDNEKNILNVEFMMEGYVAGMAHPYHVIRTVNFDLEKGRDISLADLFISNSDYLKTIADYCINELSKRNIGFTDVFKPGAEPTTDNYQTWDIAPDGLMIIFNEAQVAPYAAGLQIVIVPYSELKSLIDPNGPMGSYFQPPSTDIMAEPTPTDWVPYDPNNPYDNNGCGVTSPATVSTKDAKGLSQAELIKKLFEVYLGYFKSPDVGRMCRLEDFTIDDVILDNRIAFLAKEQHVDYVAYVIYSVQIKTEPTDWIAGNGEFASNGWMDNKELIVGVTKTGNDYVLKLIGTGP
jgi:hypothetical protein